MPTDDLPLRRLIGANLRRIRKARGLSKEVMEARCEVMGVRVPADLVVRLERGERNLHVPVLLALALALEVSPLALLLPAEADTSYPVTPVMQATGRSAYLWLVGGQPTPNPAPVDDVARVRARTELQRWVPYTFTYDGIPAEIDAKTLAIAEEYANLLARVQHLMNPED